jgi:hypothetical protein
MQKWFHLHVSAAEAAERGLGSTDIITRYTV